MYKKLSEKKTEDIDTIDQIWETNQRIQSSGT
jgi:hypothetical protein